MGNMAMGRSKTTFGKDNPPKGRPKGSENKRTTEQKQAFEIIMQLLEQRLMEGDDVINRLSPTKAGELYATLLNYKKPKLNSNSNNNQVSGGFNVIVTHQELPPLPDNDNDTDNDVVND